MRFPHAAKGVTKIFVAELLMLFGSIASAVLIVFLAIFQQADAANNAGALNTSEFGVMICGGAAGLLFLIGGVLNIIGYIQTAKDEESFVRAIILAIVSIVLTLIASFFQNQTGAMGWVYTILMAVSQLTWMFVAISAIGGLTNLSYNCNRPDMVRRGNTLMHILEAIYILTIIGILLRRLFPMFIKTKFIDYIVVAIDIIVAVLSFIQYILYLGYLGKASSMLNGKSRR